jgi:hypothetical protein
VAQSVDPADVDDETVVLHGRPPARWLRPVSWLVIAAAVAGWVVVAAAGTTLSAVQLLNPVVVTGWAVLLPFALRRTRIELRREELVVRLPLRTLRVPYGDVSAVHGDVPTRLEWSTWLVVERRHGRALTLPPVQVPLHTVHELLTQRVAAASVVPGAQPGTL